MQVSLQSNFNIIFEQLASVGRDSPVPSQSVCSHANDLFAVLLVHLVCYFLATPAVCSGVRSENRFSENF